MKKLLICLTLGLAFPAFASLSSGTKNELKQLYYQINESSDPHNDQDVIGDVKRLVNKSCNESALRALKRRQSNASFERQAKMKKIMRSTCSCVSNSDEMVSGVIKSAMLFKKHGKDSAEARDAMRNGMRSAKEKCFKKMREQMSR